MKTHKTVFRYYTIMEYEKEQEWLSRQHRQGWKLTAAAACFYRFERCAPEDVVYQLDYNPEGRKHPEEYVQLFRDCGWEHVLGRVLAALEELLRQTPRERVLCVGMGVPGLLDIEGGVSRFSPNFPQWEDVPVAAWLEERLLGPARRVVESHALAISRAGCEIVTAQLGDSAGMLGAAVYGARRMGEGARM